MSSARLRGGEHPPHELKRKRQTFAQLYGDPERLEGFLKAMTAISIAPACALAEKFPWERYKTFMDIGCGEGALPVQVAFRHPHLKGYGYDLEVVQPMFQRHVHAQGVADRIHFRTGDFCEADVLPGADVIVMGHIFHGWSVDEKKALLRKAYAALPAGGALVVYDSMINDGPCQCLRDLLDSWNLSIEICTGLQYTCTDCHAWMHDAGFHDIHVEPLTGRTSIITGIRQASASASASFATLR